MANNFPGEYSVLTFIMISSVARSFVWNSLEFESIYDLPLKEIVSWKMIYISILIPMWLWRLMMVKFNMGSEKSSKYFIHVILFFCCNFLERNHSYFADMYIDRLSNHPIVFKTIYSPLWGSASLCDCCWDIRSVSQQTCIEYQLYSRYSLQC